MREIAGDSTYSFSQNERVFRRTFEILRDTLSDESFKRFSVEKGRFSGGFAISQFETVACGIGYNVARGVEPTDVREKVSGLWTNKGYTDWTGSGITAARRLPRLIPLGRAIFGN